MSDGRSADLNSIKHKGLKYVLHDMHSKAEALDPSIPEVMDKSTRGIYHPMLARFMCPRTKLDQFDQDPELGMEDLQAGVITTKASRWPAGFYEHGVYSPGDKTKGLFRNHIVARFYQHLFIGPSSVMEQSTSRKSSKASKNRAWDLRCVDRYIIAYVHIMTYITLSHAPQWTQVIGEMDLSDLYWRIVEMLDDKTDPWVKETIGWWNSLTGPSSKVHSRNKKRPLEDGDSSEDDMAQIRAQRASRGTSGDKDIREERNQPPKFSKASRDNHCHYDDHDGNTNNDNDSERAASSRQNTNKKFALKPITIEDLPRPRLTARKARLVPSSPTLPAEQDVSCLSSKRHPRRHAALEDEASEEEYPAVARRTPAIVAPPNEDRDEDEYQEHRLSTSHERPLSPLPELTDDDDGQAPVQILTKNKTKSAKRPAKLIDDDQATSPPPPKKVKKVLLPYYATLFYSNGGAFQILSDWYYFAVFSLSPSSFDFCVKFSPVSSAHGRFCLVQLLLDSQGIYDDKWYTL
ncbi:hypothetical protein PAXINDRAFT_158542 [Paxillus involutus ATCC 200175]|uniref:Uncharacterized protein n=1 Tax=Paxillus involutus ATCC 200175 TaxID=664439 RepID=A0A0C9SWC2_PAXIN|nr:hypothetical protein PAXINDRAFT_158542 [Paxillus involutus ATCC 200175]